MEYTRDCEEPILMLLAKIRVDAKSRSEGFLAIDRNSCHIAPFAKGLHEFDILNELMEQIHGVVDQKLFYVCWEGKTDDEWFLEVFRRT